MKRIHLRWRWDVCVHNVTVNNTRGQTPFHTCRSDSDHCPAFPCRGSTVKAYKCILLRSSIENDQCVKDMTGGENTRNTRWQAICTRQWSWKEYVAPFQSTSGLRAILLWNKRWPSTSSTTLILVHWDYRTENKNSKRVAHFILCVLLGVSIPINRMLRCFLVDKERPKDNNGL